jgi:Fe2+ transport system protein FeoA
MIPMPLSMATPGVDVRLVEIRGADKFKQRLADLGFSAGVTLRVINDDGNGQLIVAVKDSRLALGRGAAQRVIISTE